MATHAGNALVVSEGLLLYLSEAEVGSLASSLAQQKSFQHWLIDLGSPALLRLLQKKMGKPMEQAEAPFKFAPQEGPEFFRAFGWKPVDVRSMFHAAGRLKRLPLMLRFLYHVQKSEAYQAKSPWAGVCLTSRQEAVSSKQ